MTAVPRPCQRKPLFLQFETELKVSLKIKFVVPDFLLYSFLASFVLFHATV